VAEKQVRVGIKVAQMTGRYDGMRDAWLEADRLGSGGSAQGEEAVDKLRLRKHNRAQSSVLAGESVAKEQAATPTKS
jgi:hypothetical protein